MSEKATFRGVTRNRTQSAKSKEIASQESIYEIYHHFCQEIS